MHFLDLSLFSDRGPFQPFLDSGAHHFRWCHNPIPDHGQVLAVLAVPADTVHASPVSHVVN